jgi:hypothetical protein
VSPEKKTVRPAADPHLELRGRESTQPGLGRLERDVLVVRGEPADERHRDRDDLAVTGRARGLIRVRDLRDARDPAQIGDGGADAAPQPRVPGDHPARRRRGHQTVDGVRARVQRGDAVGGQLGLAARHVRSEPAELAEHRPAQAQPDDQHDDPDRDDGPGPADGEFCSMSQHASHCPAADRVL